MTQPQSPSPYESGPSRAPRRVGRDDRERLRVLFGDVRESLNEHPRRLSPKFLYDARGSQLFERITRLDAYYPTRTEIGILEVALDEIRESVGPNARVIEFGTGSGRKTAMLLESLDDPASCIPIDVSETQLLEFARRVRARFPRIAVQPVVGDYTGAFALPLRDEEAAQGSQLFFFPGSTIGNLEPAHAQRFLRGAATKSDPDASFVIGVDLVKTPDLLRRAYDDLQGVTAEFNRNTIRHLVRLFGGRAEVGGFQHRAVWNEADSRIEMHLVSSRPQEILLHSVDPGDEPIHVRLRTGEPIVTEHSYKYVLSDFEALCRRAGWVPTRTWTDEMDWFAVLHLRRSSH